MEEPQHQHSTHGTATDTSITVHEESLPMTKPETTCSSDSPLSSGVSSSSSAQEDTTLPPAGPYSVDNQPVAAVADNSNEQDAIPKPSNTKTVEHDGSLDTDTLDTNEQSHTDEQQENDAGLDQQQITHHESSSSQDNQANLVSESTTEMETLLKMHEETPTHCTEEHSTPDQQPSKEDAHSNTQEESGNESVDQQHEQSNTPCEPTISEENENVDQQHEQSNTPCEPTISKENENVDQQHEQSNTPCEPTVSEDNESVDQQHEQSDTPCEPTISEDNENVDQQHDEIPQHDQVATSHIEDDDNNNNNNEEQEQMMTTDAHCQESSISNNNNHGSGPTPPVATPTPIIHPPTPSPPSAQPSVSSPEQIYQDGPLSMQHQEPDLSLTLDTRSRHLDNSHDCVTQDDESEHTVLDTHRRVWEADRHASECRRCNRRFNFLVRRHHCRRCGLVVCDRCSSHRIRLPPNEIIQDPAVDPSHYPLIAMHPQRVCDACVRLPIKEIPSSSMSSNTRRRATAPVTMRRSGSSQSLMSECPVCGHDLLGMAKKDQENHLQMCLNAGSPPVRPPRYLVYELSSNSPEISYECPICFEEFKAGEKIARMICLCSYHRHCLAEWLERGKGCPVHYDPAL